MTDDFYCDEALSGRTKVEIVVETDDTLAFYHTRPFVAAALDVGALRDVQEAATNADPRTTMRQDRARRSLDRHATYIVSTFIAGARRPD